MGKPPILGDDELLQAAGRHYSNYHGGSSGLYRAAQAQRNADLKWLCEEVEKVENHYDKQRLSLRVWWEGDTWRSQGFEDFRQKVLALLRGEETP